MLRRRMMMKKESEEKNLQWIRLDTLRDWLKPWDTTIINADNPVQTTDRFPIYAVAVLSTAGTSVISAGETQFFSTPYDLMRMSLNNRLVMYENQAGDGLVFPRTDVAQRGFIRQNIETLNEGTQNCYVYYNSIGSKCYSTDYQRGVMYFNRYQKNSVLTKYWALIEMQEE